MGKHVDPYLVIGWEIDARRTLDYLSEYHALNCQECDHNISNCFLCNNWLKESPLPQDFTILFCSPYQGAAPEHKTAYLTLDRREISIPELLSLFDQLDWHRARHLAVQLGAQDGPAEILADKHLDESMY